jgi:hypothetical protein
MTNQYVKYEDFVTNGFQDNEREAFDIFGPCDIDL